MLKIRGISNAENLLTGVNRFGHCLTLRMRPVRQRVALDALVSCHSPILVAAKGRRRLLSS